MYCMDTVLSLILLISEMQKIPRAKYEARFLKKLAFVTGNWKMPKDNRKPFKIHSSTRIDICYFFIIIITYILQSYPSKWAVSVTEMYCPI